MFKHPVFLTLAAMLCGAPATIVAVIILPWSIAIGVAGMAEKPWLAIANLLLVVAATYALGSYWLLIAKNLKSQSFKFGWSFRVSCIAALFCIATAFTTLPIVAALLVVLPIVAATFLCLLKQWPQGRDNAA